MSRRVMTLVNTGVSECIMNTLIVCKIQGLRIDSVHILLVQNNI